MLVKYDLKWVYRGETRYDCQSLVQFRAMIEGWKGFLSLQILIFFGCHTNISLFLVFLIMLQTICGQKVL